MSEAVLLAILAPIAGAGATLLLKLWDSIASRKKVQTKEHMDYRDELRQELARRTEENEKIYTQRVLLDAELRQWQRDYFELYAMFYPLRLLINTLPSANSELARAAIGPAPHERRALEEDS